MESKKITSALISVYHKDNLAQIIELLHKHQVQIYSTGGTQSFIEGLGVPVTAVESLTSYPSIFGGRVKTLHPKVFGGILYRREEAEDVAQAQQYEIPAIDLVIVDLYPFEATVASGATEEDIIEKIDIGGISLIRAAAKNFQDVVIVASQAQYQTLATLLEANNGATTPAERKVFATHAFNVSSHYDTAIFNYFNQATESVTAFKQSIQGGQSLRYGENPHQKAVFYGNSDEVFEQLNGKELSYNNLVDTNDAVALMQDFSECAYAIIKHTNACGMAISTTPKEAYLKALAADPVSAFGGVIATNRRVDAAVAAELDKLFFEILIAPDFAPEALDLLKGKKNRILLKQKQTLQYGTQFKTVLNGVLAQDADTKVETTADLKTVTKREPTRAEIEAMLFANKLVKHTKSNTIILANNNQLLASGVGQTSRVDALKQAIAKAQSFGFELKGAVMASDAFFPFPDCVEIAHEAGITAVIQPGGSIKDQASIDFCDSKGMTMVMTGFRHFKH
jgi:phosphoribosylaminoimidazolecarboxamide formyltransferase/IMP cyclohydrolase